MCEFIVERLIRGVWWQVTTVKAMDAGRAWARLRVLFPGVSYSQLRVVVKN